MDHVIVMIRDDVYAKVEVGNDSALQTFGLK